ncbi:protein shisa-like-2A isoform X1 [Agelaius tricolor]|uniref:protein shisa-like-2A isoform X1 n=1 Tax=Agelaius tricolor TaxID=9191 RepID=UPI0039F20321
MLKTEALNGFYQCYEEKRYRAASMTNPHQNKLLPEPSDFKPLPKAQGWTVTAEMIPYFDDVERHGAVTLMSCEIVSEYFLQHEKPEVANEIYGFIHDEYNKFRISPQLTGPHLCPEDERPEPEHELLVQLVQHHWAKTVVSFKL